MNSLSQAIDAVETVIKGKRDVVELIFTCILSGGHCLIEDLPGTGKTLLAKSVAKVFSSTDPDLPSFKRVQFTPDLLPSDIIGVNIFNPASGEFKLVKGPVFTHILLADEINRAGPKVQSALLEAMAEKQVTIDNSTYKLTDFFFVIATQNPLEIAGTHPLPIAQLDRFLLRIPMGYASAEVEHQIICSEDLIENAFHDLKPVVDVQTVLELRKQLPRVFVCNAISKAILELGLRSREDKTVYGFSTRSLILFKRAMQARALLKGRQYVTDQDFVDLLFPVFNHRLGIRSMEEAQTVLDNIAKPILRNLPNQVVEELRDIRLS